MLKSRSFWLFVAAMSSALASSTGFAGELPELSVKVIGYTSNNAIAKAVEVPLWSEIIPKESGGKIKAHYTPMDLIGVKDDQMMRILQLGVVDFATSDISKMAGEDPVFEGCDLAGLTLTQDKARAACAAWMPVMAQRAAEMFKIKLLALGAGPPQVTWCRSPLSRLSDLKGRKVRVFNKTMSDFIEAVGGSTISMPFAEVVPALQRGVAECGVTGTLSGNTAGWPDVTTHQFKLILGWSIAYWSVNLDSWNRFGPNAQKFFLDQYAKFENRWWETARAADLNADNCNFGYGVCEMGKPAKPVMTEVKVSEADSAFHKQIMENVVLLKWAQRTGKANAQKWNETVGKVVGMQIPVEKITSR